jgi:hypothetical protein
MLVAGVEWVVGVNPGWLANSNWPLDTVHKIEAPVDPETV